MAASGVAQAATRRVEFGRAGIGAMAVTAIVSAVVVGLGAGVLLLDPAVPLKSLAIAASPMLVIGMVVLIRFFGPGRATVDLTQRTLHTRRRSVPFHAIRRMAVFSVPRGGDWLALFDDSGRAVARFSVTWSVRREMGAAEWRALHELFWYSSAPGLERAKDARRMPSSEGVNRQAALALIAAHIAWLEQGGAPAARSSPMHRFVRGR